MKTINPITATDIEVLYYIENVEHDDQTPDRLTWLIIRALKILFKVSQNPVKLRDL